MKKYRLLGATQISLAQIGTLLDKMQQGFYVYGDLPELVAAGVLVEEQTPLDEVLKNEQTWTEISDVGSVHEPQVQVRHYNLQSTVEQVRDDQLQDFRELDEAPGPAIPTVFNAKCCRNPNVTRSYRTIRDLVKDVVQGFERARCGYCLSCEERPCPHETARVNQISGETACVHCGAPLV